MTHSRDVAITLSKWLAEQDAAGLDWLDATAGQLAAGASARTFALAFAAAPRHVGRTLLPPHPPLHGVPLEGWSRDQAARIALLLSRPQDDTFAAGLDRLFAHADLAEHVCLYQALSLLPFPDRYAGRAAEGVRSNMLPVFGAIAIGNPYPADWFDDGAWNQMIVKAIFVGRPLSGIIGLERRANPALAAMLTDYARERRAARRTVVADLWRPAGGFACSERALNELRLTLADPDPSQRHAAGLALAASEQGQEVLRSERPSLLRDVMAGQLTWDNHAMLAA